MRAWIEPLGWMLVHSVWLISIIVGVAAVVLSLLRQRSANARYLVGCVALLLSLSVLPGAFAWVMLYHVDVPDEAASIVTRTGEGDSFDGMGLSGNVSHVGRNARDFDQPPLAMDGTHDRSLMTSATARSSATRWPPATESADQQRALSLTLWPHVEARLRPHLAWLVSGWLAGVCLLSLRPLIGWRASWRLRRVGLSEVPASVSATLAALG